MMNEFIDFVYGMFPLINPYIKDRVKEAIRQFDVSGKKLNYFLFEPLEVISQGDIVGPLNFIWFNETGKMSTLKTKGILLTNTCDAQRDKFLMFAPFIPLANANEKLKEGIVKNQIYNLLYFPENSYSDYVVDFSMIQPFNRKLLFDLIEAGQVQRTASLSQFGYYLFLCKLTVHLMRPEDTEIQDNRKLAV